MIFINTIFSFVATAAFGLLINIPKRAILTCGFIGALGWLSFKLVICLWGLGLANFTGAVLIGMMSFISSKKMKMPIIIFNIPSLVPLVPGAAAYMAVRNFIAGQYVMALQSIREIIIISGAIALGFMTTNLFEKIYYKIIS